MGLHHGAHVERLEALEQPGPDDGDQAGRGDDLREIDQARRHLAARGGAREQRAHGGDDARKHFAVIELGELGKARAFRDHQADDVAAARLVDLAHEEIGDAVGEHARAAGRPRPIASMVPTTRREHGADQFLEQALLVAEVEIDGALGDAGAARHVVEPGGGEAAHGEFVERGGQDRLAAGGAARLARRAAPAGRA